MTQILIADHDNDRQQLLAQLLSSNGYTVLTASNGAQAIKTVLSEAPEILIAEWSLQGINGLDLCSFVREHEGVGHICVIFLASSEWTMREGGEWNWVEENLIVGLGAGADDYLIRPFHEKELLARIRSRLRIVELSRTMDEQHLALYLRGTQLALSNQKLEAANEQLRMAAATDELTRLFNRREGGRRLREYWASATRHNVPLACILIDIDDFKAFNDIHGHGVGDAVLQHTADVLQRFSRTDEVVCRWGGEEFLILCPRSTVRAAFDGANRLVREISDRFLPHDTGRLHITISAGVAERECAMKKLEEMIKAADTAMYAAKNTGKNCAVLADRSHSDVVRVYVGFGLKAALHLNRVSESRGDGATALGGPPKVQ